MKDVDILKDLLENRISNQELYNHNLLTVRNPELRQMYTQFRDDETRAVVKLQQKIARLEAPTGIISKMFPTKPNY
ncbi:MAG: hypothetical protein BWY74_04097 [Firmicutes bacterium ADurb.Bin419]|nr:MAG: hypothetical protein BWY74_04097 [Firmicutes bacterium ADurb.Bin419]